MCKGMTVDCIDCIETCAAAKTVVEEANDRSLFDVPQLKAHFTTTFIEVILIFTKKHNFKENFLGARSGRSKCSRNGAFSRREGVEKEARREKKEAKRTSKRQKSRFKWQKDGEQAATEIQSKTELSIKWQKHSIVRFIYSSSYMRFTTAGTTSSEIRFDGSEARRTVFVVIIRVSLFPSK